MPDEVAKTFTELKLIAAVVKRLAEVNASSFKHNLDLPDDEISAVRGIRTEDGLSELEKKGAIAIDGFGDEGFKETIWLWRRDRLEIELMAAIEKAEQTAQVALTQLKEEIRLENVERKNLEYRIATILGFDPTKLKRDLLLTQQEITSAIGVVSANQILHPIKAPLEQIQTQFRAVTEVANNFDEVYKAIIKPIQAEGIAGVRATVRWAIISILFSAVISVAASVYFSSPSTQPGAKPQQQQD